ncbi:MAG: lipocalin [Hyphomonadaceae bacterium]|nr:lipocalin [Hyphomonadaceae bacterium]
MRRRGIGEPHMRLALSAIAAALLAACTSQPDYRASDSTPPTVPSVDLDRYAGLWYEIARYPNGFERNCTGVTAEYGLNSDGTVSVTNTCFKGSLDGEKTVAEGKARIVEGSGNSKLKVKFAPAWVPFAEGDYWVLALEPDYSAALVGSPDGKYLWILSRTAQLDGKTLERLKTRAEELGYETAPLEMTLQSEQG